MTGRHFPFGQPCAGSAVWVGTYIDHSIRRDTEKCGPLIHSLQLLAAFVGDPEAVQLVQGALERSAVLGDEVIARAEVI